MAPRARRSTIRKKSDHGLQHEEIHEHQINQQTTQEQLVMTPKTKRIAAADNIQQESLQQLEPEIGQATPKGKGITFRRRRSILKRKLNHRLLEEEEIQEHEQHNINQSQEHEQQETLQQLNSEISEHGDEGQGSSKRNRGPTYLSNIWARNPSEGRILVNFNKRGQPIGPNKKLFTGFLGTLARNCRFTPLDIEDWRKVSEIRKDELLRMVKERFEVPKSAEHWILLSIGKKRRHWKSRVKKGSFVPTLQFKNQAHNRPIRVQEDQWKNLLSYWAKKEVKETSNKNKDNRQCSVMQQTTGKLSFAEVEEELKKQLGRSPSRVEMFEACFTDSNGNTSCDEVRSALGDMKEVQSKLPSGSQDSIGPSDIFSKVMGKDPRGRVRMVGLGVNPSDISGGVPSRSACFRMVLENQEALARMEEKVNEATNMIACLTEKMQQHASGGSTTRRPVSPCHSSNSTNLGPTFKNGDLVLLRSLFESKKIVAKGSIRSIDPDQNVRGKRLGLNWCEVQISVPIEWDEDLIRPYSNLSTIGDAIGTCIAWPLNLVISDDDQE